MPEVEFQEMDRIQRKMMRRIVGWRRVDDEHWSETMKRMKFCVAHGFDYVCTNPMDIRLAYHWCLSINPTIFSTELLDDHDKDGTTIYMPFFWKHYPIIMEDIGLIFWVIYEMRTLRTSTFYIYVVSGCISFAWTLVCWFVLLSFFVEPACGTSSDSNGTSFLPHWLERMQYFNFSRLLAGPAFRAMRTW